MIFTPSTGAAAAPAPETGKKKKLPPHLAALQKQQELLRQQRDLSGGSLLGFGLFLSRGELLLCGSLYRREKDTLVEKQRKKEQVGFHILSSCWKPVLGVKIIY
jgi:hypothetical protein